MGFSVPVGQGGEDPVEDKKAKGDSYEADAEGDRLKNKVRSKDLPDHQVAAQHRGRQDAGKELGGSEDEILAAEYESCSSCLFHPVQQNCLSFGKFLVRILTKECSTVLMRNNRGRSEGRYVEPEGERCYEEERKG